MSDNLRLHLFESGFLPPVLLVLMVAMVEIGWRTGTFAFAKATTTELSDDKTLIGAIFGLLALLIAFTFSGAANRFDDRRHLIVDEVRAIADAYRSAHLRISGGTTSCRRARCHWWMISSRFSAEVPGRTVRRIRR